MHVIWEVFGNAAIGAALMGWFIAQALKIPFYYAIERKWELRRFWGSGGMPSSHSSMVVSLAIMVGFLEGFDTSFFAICVVLALIVMYDAAGVRREAGTQATVINQILKEAIFKGKPISDEELKELIGHTPLEVIAGLFVGLLTALGYWALWVP